jgi:hypothetical protein
VICVRVCVCACVCVCVCVCVDECGGVRVYAGLREEARISTGERGYVWAGPRETSVVQPRQVCAANVEW